MKVIKLNTSFEVVIVPRIVTTIEDELILTAINEVSQFEITQNLVFSISNGRLSFVIDQNANFKAGNKYEIIIKKGNEIVYLGKLIVVKEVTDIQNYTPSKQRTQRFN
jgi:hypothetical protein